MVRIWDDLGESPWESSVALQVVDSYQSVLDSQAKKVHEAWAMDVLGVAIAPFHLGVSRHKYIYSWGFAPFNFLGFALVFKFPIVGNSIFTIFHHTWVPPVLDVERKISQEKLDDLGVAP